MPELKAIPGVNSVVLAGGGEKKVVITFDDKKLSDKGVTANSVTGLLQANNVSFPTGQIVIRCPVHADQSGHSACRNRREVTQVPGLPLPTSWGR